jgi:hypothetical protein
MFNQDRTDLRRVYLEAWRRAEAGAPLEPLQQQLVGIIRRHPEYRWAIEAGDDILDRDWRPEGGETNPFLHLHLGLHLAILEQVRADRPPGIRRRYRLLVGSCGGDAHDAEHRIMDCLTEALWRVQRGGGAFDAEAYLACIEGLSRS